MPVYSPWWQSETVAQSLLKLPENKPLYVYSKDQLARNIAGLKSLKNVDRVFYAMKANCNKELVQTIAASGVGIECVSIEELKYVWSIVPKLTGSQVLFTPNFASRDEYEFGFKMDVFVTLDNIFPLSAWGEVFRGKQVFIRMDPGEGKGHHHHVRTGGHQSKFGVSTDQLPALLKLIQQYEVKVVGLHVHAGSGILGSTQWASNAQFLLDLRKSFPHLKYVDLGGGLGVPYMSNSNERALDLAAVDASLASFRTVHKDLQLWLEPGRYIVADTGIILSRVTQLKDKGASKKFVGVNVGMNALIRPALYNSYHHIVNLSRLFNEKEQKDAHMVDVVGPICETGDVLGHDRMFPVSTAENDVVLISTAGAYGRVMSSSYNLREPPQEVIFSEPAASASSATTAAAVAKS